DDLCGVLMIAASKRLSEWFAAGLAHDSATIDVKFGWMLYRLFGLYVLYAQVPEFAQGVFWFTGIDYRASLGNLPPEFSTYTFWKLLLHAIVISCGLALALAPKRVDTWLSKFDVK
ncbi:MAG: hypothetical protein ACRDAM_19480, partial [Casimicrobium sp.]